MTTQDRTDEPTTARPWWEAGSTAPGSTTGSTAGSTAGSADPTADRPPVDPADTLPLFGDPDPTVSRTGPRPWGTPPPAGPTEPPGSGTSPARRGRRAVAGLALVATAVGGGVAGAVLTRAVDGNPGRTPVVSSLAGTATGRAGEGSFAAVAQAVQPSVVSLLVRGGGTSDEGSGIVISSDGQILTNNHVVAAAANGGSVVVRFSDGSTADARILGRDPDTDLAVVQAQGVSNLRPATLGSSADVKVGDIVLALGSPLGLEGSVTQGIVSALGRPVNVGSGQQTTVYDAIQTDAAINPGNSGGALVDAEGRVIGVNSAIATAGGSLGGQAGNIGVGFAIPIDEAKVVAKQLAETGQATHVRLGVSASDVTSRNGSGTGGALVRDVVSGSPAAQAGLQPGDVITAIDDTTITSVDQLVVTVRQHQVGDVVTVHFTRNGQQMTAKATLRAAG